MAFLLEIEEKFQPMWREELESEEQEGRVISVEGTA